MSGIYIPGMKMPKSCEDCPCMFDVDTAYQIACGCKLTMRIREIGNDARPDWCPLIELPPHGRLGDLDALFAERYDSGLYRNAEIGSHQMVVDWEDIEDAPTIIPAEGGANDG